MDPTTPEVSLIIIELWFLEWVQSTPPPQKVKEELVLKFENLTIIMGQNIKIYLIILNLYIGYM